MNDPAIFRNARLPDGRIVSLAVEDGRFTAIGPELAGGDGSGGTDLGGALVLPGLVDGHIHLDKTFLGGQGWRPHRPCTAGFNVRERVAFEKDELEEAGDPVARASALLERVIAHGTTHVRCHVDIGPGVGLRNLEAVAEVCDRYSDYVGVEIVAFPQSGIVTAPGTADLLDAALRNGADAIGGLDPASFDRDIAGHLDVVFGLAERHDVPVDIHLHDGDLLGIYQIEEICRRTKAARIGGRVAVSHAYALGAVDGPTLARAADLLAGAGVAIMTNAPGDHAFPPVRPLHDAGVLVFAGNDNIRDAWWPYGDGDMLERAMIVGYRSGFLVDEDLELAFAMATSHAARALGINHGIAVGKPADFVVVDVKGIPEAVVGRPTRQQVFRRGHLIAAGGRFRPERGSAKPPP